MESPRNLRYTNTHEWVKGTKELKVGITEFAQEQLGELTFVELPAVGDSFAAQEEVGVVESVKAA
ncbi:MAG: glycine cleavage system protein H, partial [Kiritimatiellae bacterium]|nr:glycine cleavage system protein H [Kiritimatiellia bacterium]